MGLHPSVHALPVRARPRVAWFSTMCFSMSASVAAGSTLVLAGAATVAMTRRASELPLALVPFLFGAQQLTEGVVWWSLLHDDARLKVASTFAYMLFSHVLWPVFVPFAMLCLEVVRWRRRVLGAALGLGMVVSLEGLWIVVRGPSTSHVCGSSIQYPMPSLVFIALYLLATCGGTMFSSRAPLRLIGAAALGLALLTLWFYAAVFVSVWCFFCAVLTVLIFGYFWWLRRSPVPVLPSRVLPRPVAGQGQQQQDGGRGGRQRQQGDASRAGEVGGEGTDRRHDR